MSKVRLTVLIWAFTVFTTPVWADVFVDDEAAKRVDRKYAPITVLIDDLTLGKRGAESRLVARLRGRPPADKALRKQGWDAVCSGRLRQMRYRAAVEACKLAGEADSQTLAQTLIATPPVRWSKASVVIPLRVKPSGGMSAVVKGSAGEILLGVDTGAEISLMMDSVARQLGVRFIGKPVTVGSTTNDITARTGILDRLRIGNAEVFNLPVVVVPDAQLTFPDGFKIPGLIGLPALVAARKAAFEDHGGRLVLGAAVKPETARTPLYWDKSGVGFAADFTKGRRQVHFDSGSDSTYLFPAAMGVLSPEEAAGRTIIKRRYAGVGGEKEEDAGRYASVTLRVAGYAWRVEKINMAANDLHGEAARVGANLVLRFSRVVLDFDAMQLSVAP